MPNESDSDPPFRLQQPRPPKKKYEPDERKRQALLLCDMNDLPGQSLMFPINGQPKEISDEFRIPDKHDEAIQRTQVNLAVDANRPDDMVR